MKVTLLTALTYSAIAAFAVGAGGQWSETKHLSRHWKETESETVWTVRYNNCDYGYYVLLRDGVVAHGTLPPNPNHGFLVSLSNPATTSSVLDQEKRIIWVDASYNASDAASPSDLIEGRQDSSAKETERIATKLGALPAIRAKWEDNSDKSRNIEEETVAFRAGIVYTIAMQTSAADISADEKEYQRIVQGFRLLKLPKGECGNG